MIDAETFRILIADCLQAFYRRRIEGLTNLKLRKVLGRKNPYLYRARGMGSASEIVEELLRDYLSASDETIFGNVFFEPIAKIVSGGHVAPSEGVDVAIETSDTYKAIAVKSGPNPQNKSAGARQNQEFQALMARVSKLAKRFDAVLGHGYGRKQKAASSGRIFRDSSGQEFWEELTGDPDCYQKLISLMDDEQIARNREEYRQEFDNARNRYELEFISDFCHENGSIDWERLVAYNSGKDRLPWSKRARR